LIEGEEIRENSYMLHQLDRFCLGMGGFGELKGWPLNSLDASWATRFKQALPWLHSLNIRSIPVARGHY